ncbi:MAG: hypothetical protein K0U54_03875 [Bacteroidetes bacterium]|nr:hypothetical protein [Bacteroidota bacterium]
MKYYMLITRKLLAIIIMTVCVYSSVAQKNESYTIPLSKPGDEGKLIVHLIDGSITVEGHQSDDVVVEASGNSRRNSKRHGSHKSGRNGMERIDDNSLSFSIEEINNQVRVKARPGNDVIDFVIKVPYDFSVDLKTINKGNIVVGHVKGTHEVSNTNGKITMNDVSGSVVADALNQDIIVTFKEVYANTNMMFSSLNGDVDISFPESLKATISARSDNGNVYTDFEVVKVSNGNNVNTTRKDGVYKVSRKRGVSGTINGGGSDINFKTLNGDVLIRSN